MKRTTKDVEPHRLRDWAYMGLVVIGLIMVVGGGLRIGGNYSVITEFWPENCHTVVDNILCGWVSLKLMFPNLVISTGGIVAAVKGIRELQKR